LSRKCTVCNHPERQEVDLALAKGESYRDIADQFSVTKTSLVRHRRSHLPMHLVRAKEAREVTKADNLLANLVELQNEAGEIGDISVPDQPMSGKLPLSREVVSIIVDAIKKGCAAASFEEALEVGYKGFAQTECTDAAKEGISAFLQKRKPEFKK